MFTVFKKQIQLQQGETNRSVNLNDELRVLYYTILDESDMASIELLTADNNPAIRCLMFIGLAQKEAPDSILERVYLKHQNDSARYISRSGCLVNTWKVNEWMQFGINSAKEDKIRKINFEKEIARIIKQNNHETRMVLPGLKFNRIKKEALLKIERLICLDTNYKVISFTLYDGEKLLRGRSDFINKDMKTMMRKIKPQNRIYIEGIKVKSPDGHTRKLRSINLIIE